MLLSEYIKIYMDSLLKEGNKCQLNDLSVLQTSIDLMEEGKLEDKNISPHQTMIYTTYLKESELVPILLRGLDGWGNYVCDKEKMLSKVELMKAKMALQEFQSNNLMQYFDQGDQNINYKYVQELEEKWEKDKNDSNSESFKNLMCILKSYRMTLSMFLSQIPDPKFITGVIQ